MSDDGIPADKRDKVFKPFHLGRALDRVDVSSARGGGIFALRGHF